MEKGKTEATGGQIQQKHRFVCWKTEREKLKVVKKEIRRTRKDLAQCFSYTTTIRGIAMQHVKRCHKGMKRLETDYFLLTKEHKKSRVWVDSFDFASIGSSNLA